RWGVLGAGDDLREVPTEPGAYLDFYRGVESALRAGGPPPVTPDSAVAALEVIEAARRSASGQGVVRLG
ncbi:oxidoreductase, partial [Nonomuraea sp. MCN248]|nr:oxidoreductase [Nonomuraea corallina]